MDFFRTIDQLPVNEIKPLVLLNVLGRMESRGATEQSRKVRERCSEFFVTPSYQPDGIQSCSGSNVLVKGVPDFAKCNV